MKKNKRELSPAVQTRWYRSPEVIMLENYDTKIDIWSFGCVFSEILNYLSNAGKPMSPTSLALFPGHSCNPLSPIPSDQQPSGLDQL